MLDFGDTYILRLNYRDALLSNNNDDNVHKNGGQEIRHTKNIDRTQTISETQYQFEIWVKN